MGFTEKVSVGIIASTIAVYGWYFTDAIGRALAGQTSINEFGMTMWIMFGVYVALCIAAAVIAGIVSRGEDLDEFDERDQLIDIKAERLGSYAQGVGLFGILVLVMMGYGAFILAHAILAVMVAATLLTFGARLYFYRRGY